MLLLYLSMILFILAGCIMCNLTQKNTFSDEVPALLLCLFLCFGTGMCCIGAGADILSHKVRCETPPQIDTLVMTKNGVSDTTFVYNFPRGCEKNEE